MTDIVDRLNGANYVDAIDDAIHEIGRLRNLEEELFKIRNAIRRSSHDPRLLRLAGPDSYERERAAAREKLMAELSPRCELGNPDPSPGARGYREQYQRVMRIQAVYRWKYGK